MPLPLRRVATTLTPLPIRRVVILVIYWTLYRTSTPLWGVSDLTGLAAARQGETERRMVVVGRALPDYQPSSASVPLARHATHLPTQHRWPEAAASKPQINFLPPPPTRLVELDDRIDTEQNLITWSKHESLDEDDDDEPEPHPFTEVLGLGDCPLSGRRLIVSPRRHRIVCFRNYALCLQVG